MTEPTCGRTTLADLTDYAAGELTEAEAAAIDEHLFSCAACAARAAEFDALVRAIPPAVRSAEVGGFVTDAVLNRLSRDGARVRTFALSPGAVVPCAVWDGDELMAMRMRADLRGASEVTMSQRIGGTEVIRATGQVAGADGEIIYVLPASWVRQLAVVEVEVILTAHEAGHERFIGSYRLFHGGSLQR
jgi:anti-sigma factor RsiW